jgi:Tfp pilus assembly protein PilF
VVCFLSAPAFAAKTKIGGVVVDTGGLPIVDATVAVLADDLASVGTASTDANGRFKMSLKSRPGCCAVRVERPGYLPLQEALDLDRAREGSLVFVLMGTEEARERAEKQAAIERREAAYRLYNQGAKAYNEGRFDTARRSFEEALERQGDMPEAWAAIARLEMDERNWPAAIEAARRLVELAPQEGTLLLLYDAYWAAGEAGAARAMAERLAQEFPGPGVAARLANEGVAALRAGDWATAVERLRQALELDPSLIPARLLLARALIGAGNLEGGLKELDGFFAAGGSDPDALLLKVDTLRALGREDDAGLVLDRLEDADPELARTVLLNQGVEHFRAGRSAAAAAALESALALDPDHPATHYQLALTYASLGRMAEAKARLQEFLRLAPEDPEAAMARRMLESLD